MKNFLFIIGCLLALAIGVSFPLHATNAQFIDRITRPCAAGAVLRALAIANPNSTGNIELTPCTGGSVTINGTAIVPGGGTINPTNAFIPYRSNATTFLDSPLARTSAALVTSTASINLPTLILAGATSGTLTIAPPAIAGSNTLTLPAGTTNFTATGGASQVVKQVGVGSAFTVARLACADLSDGAAGCSSASVGTTINTTDTVLPYRLNATTFADSPLARSGAGTMTLTGTLVQTSAAAAAFESGPNGSTNPVLRLVNSTASQADGVAITGLAAGGGVAFVALSSGADAPITLTPKGLGRVILPNGTVGLPILRGTDNDSGFYFDASGFPALGANGASLLTTDGANMFATGSITTQGGSVIGRTSVMAFDSFDRIAMAATIPIAWSSTGAYTGSKDTHISRNAAGIIQIGTTTANSAGTVKAANYTTDTNCIDSAGAAACGSASAGSVVIDAGSTSVVVSTTAVTANSQIFVQYDSSLGARLSVTCNTTPALPAVTARTAATSFTITVPAGPITDPACYSYRILN